MKRWSIWHWGFVLISSGVAALLAIGFVSAINARGIGSAEAASWLQAIGTIVAIVAAFVVANQQRLADHRLEDIKQLKADIRQLEIMAAILSDIAATVDNLHSAWNDSDVEKVIGFDPHRLSDHKMVLEAIPVFELPHDVLVLFVTPLVRTIGELQRLIVLASDQSRGPSWQYEWQAAADVPALIDMIRLLADRAQNQCDERLLTMRTTLNRL